MGERRFSRSGMLLLLGLLPALAIGAFVAVRDASHAAPPPPTVARIAAPLLPTTAIPISLPPAATATKPFPTTTTAVVLAPGTTLSPTIAVPPTATTPPAATLTPLPPPTVTPLPAMATVMATALPPTPTPEPTAEPTPLPLPTAPLARAWVEVGRWRGSDILYTASFTVQGPWRIRWQLSSSAEPCQVMIIDGSANPPLLTGPSGATHGIFGPQGVGTFSLMLHNTIPYEIVVEDFR